MVKEWITPTLAVLGFGLGLWGRWDKWRENKEKTERQTPFARLEFDGHEAVIDAQTSRRGIQIRFHNPTNRRWRAYKVEIIEPKTSRVSRMVNDPEWGENIDVDWILPDQAEAQGESRARLYLLYSRLDADGPVGPAREVALIIYVSEISSRRRKARIDVRTARHF